LVSAPPDTSPVPASLAALAHELRTPLAAIIGYADAMRERAFGPLSEQYVECAETVEQAARHMLALVERMSGSDPDRRGPERGQAGSFDALAGVAEVARMLKAGADVLGVSLAAEFPAGSLPAQGDALALKQVAINLIANALAATPRGGTVSLSLDRRGDDLILVVDDTGRGPEGVVDGLGLALVRGICAAQGGELTLHGRAGGGTRATARLPILADA
jgi:cell cycle sensor histidine kinase DivJ